MKISNSVIVFCKVVSLLAILAVGCFMVVDPVWAAGPSQQNPQSETEGFEATVPGTPPTQAATIAIPANGQTFTNIPITVSGLCKSGLLIKIFANNVFVGATQCSGGSYSLQVDLFSGSNELVARDYDNLDQQGPDSNAVTETFNDAQYAQFGSRVVLSSDYARQGVDPGTTLSWPLILSGGTGPYALSVDWGDGSGADLKSVSFSGVVNVSHVYNQAGVYTIVAKATDANNTSAYLQLVGVANGPISGAIGSSSSSKTSGSSKTVVIWQPMLIALPIILIAFWLGRRHELYMIRRTIESSR